MTLLFTDAGRGLSPRRAPVGLDGWKVSKQDGNPMQVPERSERR